MIPACDPSPDQTAPDFVLREFRGGDRFLSAPGKASPLKVRSGFEVRTCEVMLEAGSDHCDQSGWDIDRDIQRKAFCMTLRFSSRRRLLSGGGFPPAGCLGEYS